MLHFKTIDIDESVDDAVTLARMAMDGFEYNPQVNFETMQKHIKSKVRLVGELMTVDNNVAVVKSSDGTPVNIELQTRASALAMHLLICICCVGLPFPAPCRWQAVADQPPTECELR